MNDTYVTVVGNVVDEPQLRHTGSGVPVLSFRIASSSRRYDKERGAWVDNQRLYASVTCWRALAQNVSTSLRKGQPVVVAGRLYCREYQKEETSRLSYQIDADAVGHDLARGTAAFTRVQRQFAPDDGRGRRGRPAAARRRRPGRRRRGDRRVARRAPGRRAPARPGRLSTTVPDACRPGSGPGRQVTGRCARLGDWTGHHTDTEVRVRGSVHLHDAEGAQGARRQGHPRRRHPVVPAGREDRRRRPERRRQVERAEDHGRAWTSRRTATRAARAGRHRRPAAAGTAAGRDEDGARERRGRGRRPARRRWPASRRSRPRWASRTPTSTRCWPSRAS